MPDSTNNNAGDKKSIFEDSELSELNNSLEEIEQLRSKTGENSPVKNLGLEKKHRKKLKDHLRNKEFHGTKKNDEEKPYKPTNKKLRIIAVTILFFFLAFVPIAYLAPNNPIITKIIQIHEDITTYIKETEILQNKDELYKIFLAEYEKMGISGGDQEKIYAYFSGDSKALSGLDYDVDFDGDTMKLGDLVKNSKMLIDSSRHIDAEKIKEKMAEIHNSDKDPLDVVYDLFSLMDQYLMVEKFLLMFTDPNWSEEAQNLSSGSLRKSLDTMKSYNSYVEEFAGEHGFDLENKEIHTDGLINVEEYKEIQKNMAEEMGIDYNDEVYEDLEGLKKYKELQKESKGSF